MTICYYRSGPMCFNRKITSHGFPLSDTLASRWFCVHCKHKTLTPLPTAKKFSGYVKGYVSAQRTHQAFMEDSDIVDEDVDDA